MVSAHAVFNTADTYGEVWHLGPEDRGIVCLPMAWMYGLASTSLALLLRGAAVVVVSRARPELLVAAIRQHRATFLAGVTTTFAKLLQHAEESGLDPSTFETLRLCISGGEPRNEAAFERWFSFSGVAVLDAYCSSECLPLVTYDPLIDPVPRLGSAGKLVPRSKLRVVDPQGAEVPVGDVGEALSSGPGLMLGYWRDESLTAEAMTADGWFRTKDLVRIDEDGYVYVVGRLSDLIIRGGINISPGEVERVIRQHDDVADVAVVGVPDDIYGERVLAAVVPRDTVDLDDLKAAVAANLTAYKVPSEYVVVESIPVNSTTGKVDRRSLVTVLLAGTSQEERA
jgi:long-chain acyl-CoA synthetase